MTHKLALSIFILAILLTSCKEKTLEYKFQGRINVLVDCSFGNDALLKEAQYSFQEDLAINLPKNDPEFKNEIYNYFVRALYTDDIDFNDAVTPHSLAVFEELKKYKELWDLDNPHSNLNYKSEFMTCLISNFKDDDLRIAMQNLIEVNSMRPKLIIEPILYSPDKLAKDSNLKTYIALELYYAKFFDKDIQPVNTNIAK